jgi:hypothetical protein
MITVQVLSEIAMGGLIGYAIGRQLRRTADRWFP